MESESELSHRKSPGLQYCTLVFGLAFVQSQLFSGGFQASSAIYKSDSQSTIHSYTGYPILLDAQIKGIMG